MTPEPTPNDCDCIQRLLGELETCVRRHADLLAAGDLPGLETELDRCAQLLQSVVGKVAHLTPADLRKLGEINRLHQRTCLAAASQKQGVADQLADLRRGGKALRAYGE